MILVDSKLSAKDTKSMLSDIENVDGVNFAIGLDSVEGSLVPSAVVPSELTDDLISDNYKLLIVSSSYQVATDEIKEQCTEINNIIKSYDKSSMFIGEAPATKDLIDITDHDFKVVSAVSIGAIFLLIFFVLKSITLPIILVAVVELAKFM